MKQFSSVLLLTLLITFVFVMPLKADEEADQEFRKIIATVAEMSLFSTEVDIQLEGDYLKAKPNFPRTGKLLVAVNKKSHEDTRRKFMPTINTVKGDYEMSLAQQKGVTYLNLKGLNGKNTSYFFDPKKPASSGEGKMLESMIGQAKGKLGANKDDLAAPILEKIKARGELFCPAPGQLKLRDEKKPENDIQLFYDSKSYLPKRFVIRDNNKGVLITLNFPSWKLSGDVDTKLPLEAGKYKAFSMKELGNIVQALPQRKQIMAAKPAVEAVGEDTTFILPKPTFPKPVVSRKLDTAKAEMSPAVSRDLKETVTHMKKVVEILRDKDFQRSLRKLSYSLKKMERHLEKIEKLQEGK